MRLSRKSAYGLVITGLGVLFIMSHPAYRGGECFSPLYAIEEGGAFLVAYAVFLGGVVGLIIRLLTGSLAERTGDRITHPRLRK